MRYTPTPPVPRSALSTFGFALVLCFLALWLSMSTVMEQGRFFPFLAAIIISAWYGGFRAGFFAFAVSLILLIYFLISPRRALAVDPSEDLELFIFAAFSLLIVVLQGRSYLHARELSNTKIQLEAILSAISDGVTATNDLFKFVYINDAAAHMLGFESAAEMEKLGAESVRSRLKVLDAQGKEIPWSELPNRRSLASGQETEMTYGLVNLQTGVERWVVQKSAPLLDSRGNSYLSINILRDVTERRQHEDDLQVERQRLRDLIDNLPAFVGFLTLDGTVVEVNGLALQLANLKSADVLGKPFERTYWWSYSNETQEQLRAAIVRAAAGQGSRFDIAMRTGPETSMTVDFMLSPVLDEDGQVAFLIPAAVDITSRKQVELERTHLTLALAAERRRLKTILDNTPGVLWEAKGRPDQGQIATFASDYVEKLFGYTAQDWVAQPDMWQKIVHPEDAEQALADSVAAYEQGGGTVEYRIVKPDNTSIYIETRSNVLPDENNQPSIITAVTMDVTDRKLAEASLKRYASELKRSNEELQQFAYVASHDLQEPLRMVTSYVQLLERRYADRFDEEGREFINYAVDGAARMKLLIGDLLAYSRVESGGRALVPTDLNRVLQTVLHDLSLMIEDTGAQVESDSLPTINADEHQMRQLFLNLIGNAIKFQTEGRTPKVEVRVKRRGNEWQFSIADNGIGIEEQYLDRIFILFQRLHARSKYTGTGIGLAICRRVVERHGGKIRAESKPGVGTIFYFTLPVS